MRALTLRQPWAELVAAGVKTIEVRSWATSYRGVLAIHAGKTAVTWAATNLAPDEVAAYAHRDFDAGAIVATVDLRDVRDLHPHDQIDACTPLHPEPYAWAWVLANQRRLREPVPARGHQGLWPLTAAQQAAVEAQL